MDRVTQPLNEYIGVALVYSMSYTNPNSISHPECLDEMHVSKQKMVVSLIIEAEYKVHKKALESLEQALWCLQLHCIRDWFIRQRTKIHWDPTLCHLICFHMKSLLTFWFLHELGIIRARVRRSKQVFLQHMLRLAIWIIDTILPCSFFLITMCRSDMKVLHLIQINKIFLQKPSFNKKQTEPTRILR